VLTDRGLGPAVEALAARLPLPVQLDVTAERFPAPVEATLYFVVAEALTNVAKYAEASHARVRVGGHNGEVVAEVVDDGCGGADPVDGSGLRGLADRVAAVDGRLAVSSPVGGGTTVRAAVPIAPVPAAVGGG
jgi:signal transduction histidine kinase